MSTDNIGPLSKGLKGLTEFFFCVDRRGIAPNLKDGVQKLVQSAWDGSMLVGTLPVSIGNSTRKIPLKDAIRISTAELDTSSMAYMAEVSNKF